MKSKCIEFKLYFEDPLFNYEKYLKSHKWEIKSSGEGWIYICKRCKIARLHSSGSLDFWFKCILMPTGMKE